MEATLGISTALGGKKIEGTAHRMVKEFENLVLRKKKKLKALRRFPLGKRRLKGNGITDFGYLKR